MVHGIFGIITASSPQYRKQSRCYSNLHIGHTQIIMVFLYYKGTCQSTWNIEIPNAAPDIYL
jgi:hypothetical protein